MFGCLRIGQRPRARASASFGRDPERRCNPIAQQLTDTPDIISHANGHRRSPGHPRGASTGGLAYGYVSDGDHLHFLLPNQELSYLRDRSTGKRHRVRACTPVMATGLTDHIWGVYELLCFEATPGPWVDPKRRGRPCTRPLPDLMFAKRPSGRLRKKVLCSSTS